MFWPSAPPYNTYTHIYIHFNNTYPSGVQLTPVNPVVSPSVELKASWPEWEHTFVSILVISFFPLRLMSLLKPTLLYITDWIVYVKKCTDIEIKSILLKKKKKVVCLFVCLLAFGWLVGWLIFAILGPEWNLYFQLAICYTIYLL